MTIYGAEVYRGLDDGTRQKAVSQKLNYTVVNGNPYSTETGDYLGDKYIHDLVPRRTAGQYKVIESKRILDEHETENGGFVFTFFKQSHSISERFPTLAVADIARLMYIATYAAWGTGRLQYDNGRVIDRKGLEAMTKLSTKRSRELFERFVAEGILAEQENGIYMNPTVFYRGNIKSVKTETADMSYTRMFKQTVRDLYDKSEGRTVGQLALVYSIMPFLNFASNVVSHNPDESDTDLVQPMTLDELAEKVGYANAGKLKTAMNKIKIDGQVAFGFFENPNDRRSKRIVVNPRVVFAGNGTQLAAIKVLFN